MLYEAAWMASCLQMKVTVSLVLSPAAAQKNPISNIIPDPSWYQPQRPLRTGADTCKTGSGSGSNSLLQHMSAFQHVSTRSIMVPNPRVHHAFILLCKRCAPTSPDVWQRTLPQATLICRLWPQATGQQDTCCLPQVHYPTCACGMYSPTCGQVHFAEHMHTCMHTCTHAGRLNVMPRGVLLCASFWAGIYSWLVASQELTKAFVWSLTACGLECSAPTGP